MPISQPISATRPPAGYCPKSGGFLAATSFRKGVAWDVDGLSAISVKFLTISRTHDWVPICVLSVAGGASTQVRSPQ